MTRDMKKIQQGYSRVIVELMVLFAIIYAGIQNVFGKESFLMVKIVRCIWTQNSLLKNYEFHCR